MSIPADQHRNVGRQSLAAVLQQPQPLPNHDQVGPQGVEHEHVVHEIAANDDRIDAPREEVRNAPQRTYVSVANLHQGNAWADKFHRVNPDETQIRNELGKGFEKVYEVIPAGSDRMAIPQAKLKDAYQHDFKETELSYNELRDNLKVVADKARKDEKKGLSIWQRFKNLFAKTDKAELTFKARYQEGDSDQLSIDLSVKKSGAAGSEPTKIQISDEFTRPEHQDGNEKDGKSVTVKKWLYGAGNVALVGVGVGAFAAIGAATAVVWAPFVLGAVGIGALGGAGYMAGKLMFGKHPWWGGTVRGKIEHAERKQARELANQIEEQVFKAAMTDKRQRNVDAEGKVFEKRDIENDATSLQDFILLAKTLKPKDLKAKIRSSLVDPPKGEPKNEAGEEDPIRPNFSPLTTQTINYSKGKGIKWFGFAQGRPKAHAKKTVDTYAEEIAQGIMRGISRAVVQTRIGALSDDLSSPARDEIAQIKAPVEEEFIQALDFLNPVSNKDPFLIAKPAEQKTKLKALLGPEGAIDKAIVNLTPLPDGKPSPTMEIIGQKNAEVYKEALTTFKDDVDKHINSLTDIENLIGKPQGQEQPEANAQQTPIVLMDINREIRKALDGSLQNDVSIDEAQGHLTGLAEGLKKRVQSADDPNGKNLVQAHAEQFMKLVERTSEVGKAAIQFAKAETGANQAFQDESLSIETVKEKLDNLKTTKDTAFKDLNVDPSGLDDPLVQSQVRAYERMEKQIERCEAILDASKYSTDAKTLADQTVADLLKGKRTLKEILKEDGPDTKNMKAWNIGFDKEAHLWQMGYEKEMQAPDPIPPQYQLPVSPDSSVEPAKLSIITLKDWKNQLFAAYLGVDANKAPALTKVLTRLVENTPAGQEDDEKKVLGTLKKFGQDNPEKLLQLLQRLEQDLPGDPDQPPNLALALKHLALLKDEYGMPSDAAEQVALALHKGAADILGKANSLQEVVKLLRTVNSEMGDKLRDLTRAEDAAASSDDRDDPAFLDALVKFLQDNAQTQGLQELSRLENLEALQAVAQQLRNSQRAAQQSGQDLDGLLSQAEGIEPYNRNHLDLTLKIISHLATDSSESVQILNTLHDQRAQRLAQAAVLANAIVPGASSSSDEALKQLVMQDAAPKEESQREALAELVQTLLARYGQAQDQKSLVHLNEMKIKEAAQALRGYLSFKGTEDQLIEKIKNDPYVGLLLWRYMEASAKLSGVKPLPGLAHEFAPQQVFEGAKTFATEFVKTNEAGMNRLVKLQSLDMVKKRNLVLGQLKDKESALPDKQLRSKLNNSSISAYVKGHLQEERVYKFLWETMKTSTPKNVRAALEGSYDRQENTNNDLAGLAVRALAHHREVEQHILKGLERRIKVLRALLEEQTATFGEVGASEGFAKSELERLQGQLEQVKQGVRPLLEVPEVGGVKMLGALMLDADVALGSSEEDLKLSYIRGQQAETARALRHFNVRKLTEAVGWSNVFYRLFKRGEANLRSIVAKGKAQEISDAISLIAAGSEQTKELMREQKQIEAEIQNLQDKKEGMVKNQQTVKSAYALLMMEHLADSAGSNNGSAISVEDHAEVAKRLEEMLGANSALQWDVALTAKQYTNINDLMSGLNLEQNAIDQMEVARLEMDLKQQALEKEALALKERIAQAAIEKAQEQERKLIETATTRLGLQAADYLILKGLMPKDEISSMITQWVAVFDDIESRRHGNAWARASDLRLKMESKLAASTADLEKRQTALRAVLDKVESEMGSSMPDQVYKPLDSFLDPSRLAARARKLYTDLELSYLALRPIKAPNRQQSALLNKVEAQRVQLEQLLKEIQHPGPGAEGGKLKDAAYSLRTAQQLGVACQAILGRALYHLDRIGMTVLSDRTECLQAARIHLYNSNLIAQDLKAREGFWAPTSYKPESGDDQYDKRRADFFKDAFPGFKGKKFTADTLKQIKEEGWDPLNTGMDEDEQEIDSGEVRGAELTTVILEPAGGGKGFNKRR